MKFPIESTAVQPVLAVVQINSKPANCSIEVMLPLAPVVVLEELKLIVCPAFWAILKRPEPFPTTCIVSPSEPVAGRVRVTNPALLAI